MTTFLKPSVLTSLSTSPMGRTVFSRTTIHRTTSTSTIDIIHYAPAHFQPQLFSLDDITGYLASYKLACEGN